MVCNACVFSIARIEHNDFDSLHSVAAIPSLAVDIDDNNPACTVHPSHLSSTMYRLSTLLPPPPSSSYTLSRRSRIHLYKQSHTLAIHQSIQITLPTLSPSSPPPSSSSPLSPSHIHKIKINHNSPSSSPPSSPH